METKKCVKCFEIKELKYFPKTQKWYRNKCKQCCSDERKEYRNSKDISEKNKLYQKNYRKENIETIKKKDKCRKEKNKERISIESKKYYQKNKQNIIDRNIKYEKNRKRNDPNYKILKNLRKRLRDFIVSNKEKEKTIDLIGCDVVYLKKWLEFQFSCYMNWNNYGSYWVLDHVKPCCLFDLTCAKGRMLCFNWKNIRPLERNKNASKSNKYNEKIQHLHNIVIKSFLLMG